MSESHPLTVLHVAAPGVAGGLESVILELAGGHRRLGHRTVLLATVAPEFLEHPVVRRAAKRGIEVIQLTVAPRSYMAEYRGIRDTIAGIRPDVVHTHGYRADILGGLAARYLGVPWVSTAHGFTGGGLKNRFYEWLQVMAYRRAHAVIAVSGPIRIRLEQSGVPPERVAHLPNAIGPNLVLERLEARLRLGVPEGAFAIGWVGRLSHEKGADVFLDALAKLRDLSWTASIVGGGRERKALGAQARLIGIVDRVLWHGMVEQASAHFAAFDLFVLSSRTEGTPITLLEAALARVPIVSTSVGGVPDMFAQDEVSLVPPENPGALADAVRALMDDPGRRQHTASMAFDAVTERFSVDAWLRHHQGLYAAVVASEGSQR